MQPIFNMKGKTMTTKSDDPAVDAAYQFMQKAEAEADGFRGSATWYGWMAREAFLAGVKWERQQKKKAAKAKPTKTKQTPRPFTDDASINALDELAELGGM